MLLNKISQLAVDVIAFRQTDMTEDDNIFKALASGFVLQGKMIGIRRVCMGSLSSYGIGGEGIASCCTA